MAGWNARPTFGQGKRRSQQAVPLTFETTPTAVERPGSKSFVGHAKLIGVLTLVSRITGLAREIVAGHFLGAGVVASAFTVAFTIPNLFRKLFGEGALSAAFIPLYAQAVRKEREPGAPHSLSSTDSANAFAAASVNLLCIILLGLTLLGELIIAAILLLSRHLTPADLLTLKFAAVMLPYVLLICGTAFLGAILQVHKRFGAPAAAPIILNVCHVAVVLIGARILGLGRGTSPDREIALQTTLGYWLSFFVLVAGVMQALVLFPSLKAVGFRFQLVLHVWTPAIRKMLRLTVPVALGAGVLQLSVLLDKGLSMLLMRSPDASGHLITTFSFFGHVVRYPMETGAPMRLNLAQFLYQFPLGVFAIALATAIFPSLSAVALDKDRERFKGVLRNGIEATLFEGLPASIGLILVREPAVRLLFQNGLIRPHDAELISRSVLFFSAAIWAFSLQQIINRAYYALHDTMTPLIMSIVTLSVNLAVELPLVWTNLGEAGMAAGTLASFSAQALVMLFLLDRRVGGLGLRRSAGPILKMVVATGLMGAACVGIQHIRYFPQGSGRMVWAAQVTLIIAVGAAVYLGACAAMGVDIVGQFVPGRKARGATMG